MKQALEFVRTEPVLAMFLGVVALGLMILVAGIVAFSTAALSVKLDMPPAEQPQ